jgi:hypothetical protein
MHKEQLIRLVGFNPNYQPDKIPEKIKNCIVLSGDLYSDPIDGPRRYKEKYGY